MRVLGNLLWLLFGGLETAIGYFTGSLALACTIIGIPFALQIFKLGLFCLWPFGSEVVDSKASNGCLGFFMNVFWIIFGGFLTFLCHVLFGVLLCVTLIGIPFGTRHFKLAGLALAPFGKEVRLGV